MAAFQRPNRGVLIRLLDERVKFIKEQREGLVWWVARRELIADLPGL